MNRADNEHKIVLTANERNYYNKMYGNLAFDGTGSTNYKGIGNMATSFKGIRETMESYSYKHAGDEEKAKMISEILRKAKMLTRAQMVIDKGYVK